MKQVLLMLLTVVCLSAYSQCANEDFEQGNTAGWTGYTGMITYTGKVDVAKQGIVNGRHTIMSGLEMDEVSTQCGVPIPRVAPGGLFSLRLGNSNVGGEAERITKTFVVQPGKEFFLYKYAVVLEDPQHNPNEQPRFEVRVFDKNGNLAPCGVFRVRAGPNAANDGFTLCEVPFNPQYPQYKRRYWVKSWTVAGADLSAFVGQQVTIEFLTTDCALRGHAGYAYVEASCKELDISVDGLCPGNSATTVSVTEGFQKYEWSNGAKGPNAVYNNLKVGDTVSVKVTSYGGCSSTFSKVLEPPLPVTADPLADQLVCKGYPAAITATGTNVGYIYWPQLNLKSNVAVVVPNAASDYFMEVFDKNGCPTGIKDTARIDVKDFTINVAKTDLSCNSTNDGTISLSITGGVAPFTYSWKGLTDTTPNVSNLKAGEYEVTVTDDAGNGCIQKDTIEIISPSTFQLEADFRESQCVNNNGKAEVIVKDASGTVMTSGYTFLWPYNNSAAQKLEPVPAGDYEVLVTESGGAGCTKALTISVPEPTIILNLEAFDARCVVDDGFAEVSPQGGSSTYTYLWSTGATTSRIENLSANVLPARYWVTVRDTYGCEATEQFDIAPPPNPLVVGVQKRDALCSFQDGIATAQPQGGLNPYEYLWSTGDSTRQVANLPVVTHSVVVTDGNGCVQSATFIINDPPPLLTLDVESEDAVCSYNDGKARAIVGAGTQPYQYTWLPNTATTPDIMDVAVGDYTLQVTDANGCTETRNFTINAPFSLMTLTLTSSGESYNLRNGSAEVVVTGGNYPYLYLWAPGNITSSLAEGLAFGDYIVDVTDAKGCVVRDTVTVEKIPPIEIPNAFTPNGDVINDTWELRHIDRYPASAVTIFNRWGNKIFHYCPTKVNQKSHRFIVKKQLKTGF